MAIIPFFRVVVFVLLTLCSLVVLGVCAHIEWLLSGYTDLSLSFVVLGLTTACLTIISIPLFSVLDNHQRRAFTPTILLETVWFFILWVLWVGAAGDAAAGMAFHFPGGCIYNDHPEVNQTCHEFAVVETFSFLNFFCAFVYYDVILLYAIINAIRDRGIWTISIKEAATHIPGVISTGAPTIQPQFNTVTATRYQTYDVRSSNVPFTQPYSTYPPQASLQGSVPQEYPPQPLPYGLPIIPPDQLLLEHFYSSTLQQQVSYPAYAPSPAADEAPPPTQPGYEPYHASGSQTQLTSPRPQSSPFGYRSHPSIPV